MSAALYERLRALCRTPAPPELGPGPRPGITAAADLRTQFAALSHEFPPDRRRAQLVLGSLLWWHDHLGAAHTLAQQIPDASGSYLHALMHRREPDYANAAYWFRRAGNHPVLTPLSAAARDLLQARGEPETTARLLPGGRWDNLAFLELCATAAREPESSPRHRLACELQQLEFEVWLRWLCDAA